MFWATLGSSFGFTRDGSTQTLDVEWKMGTGSEPPQIPNLREDVAGSVPVPFFHAFFHGAQ